MVAPIATTSMATPAGHTPTRNLDGGSSGLTMPLFVGLGAGAIAGLVTASAAAPSSLRIPLGIGAGLAAAVAAGGGAALLRGLVEREPAPAAPDGAPSAPPSDPVAPLPSGTSPAGRLVGTTYDSDYQCTTDSDGDQECHWETDRDPIRLLEAIGRREGYASIAQAIDATQAGNPVAVLREGSTYRPYLTEPVDLTPSLVEDAAPDLAAFASGNDWVFSRDRVGDEDLRAREHTDRPETSGVEPRDRVARLALHQEFDGDVRVAGTVSDAAGFTTRGEAVGEANARPGDHVVTEHGGRFHVSRVTIDKDPNGARLDGVRTAGDRGPGDALEYRGETLVPYGDYWVAPRA